MRLSYSLADPWQPGGFGRRALLIQLSLKCDLDGGHVQLALDPADDGFGGQVGVGDDAALGLLQADAAIGGAGIGAIGGKQGPMHGEDDAISRVAFEVEDSPGVGGGHGGVVRCPQGRIGGFPGIRCAPLLPATL